MQLSVPSCGTRKLKESGLPEGPLAHTRQVPGAFMGELRPPTLVNSTQQSKEKPRETHMRGLLVRTDTPVNQAIPRRFG